MKKSTKTIILIAVVVALMFILKNVMHHLVIRSILKNNGADVSVLDETDGPTAVFYAGKVSDDNEDENKAAYISITMDEAKEIFATEGDYIIVDVRRGDEFATGHIPGAINIPNEDIGTIEPAALSDKEQTIYIYCRSGNRSKQASNKLVAMGYKNIIEFGGIQDWNGEVEK